MKEKILNELKESELLRNQYNIELLTKIKAYNKVILYGISESAVEAIKFLKNEGIPIFAIYDDDPSKQNTKFYGINIIKPEITCKDKEIAILVTISFYDIIKEKFLPYDQNIEDRLFIYDGYFQENLTINYFEDNIDKIVSCYKNLEDEKSKELYLALLKYRYVRDVNIIKNLYEHLKLCYFDKVFLEKFRDGLYIDVGSYNADFITSLAQQKDVTKSKFYIFEPNKIFYKKIKSDINDKFNCKLFQIALCDIKSKMEFRQTNTSTSHLFNKKYNAYKNTLKETVDFVNTDTLDNIIKEERVTGIKVDIEGSEQQMIKGATNIIKRDRPIILLSIYHRANDLFELQYYLQNLHLDYKFYIRHYSLNVAKTILYCIPN